MNTWPPPQPPTQSVYQCYVSLLSLIPIHHDSCWMLYRCLMPRSHILGICLCHTSFTNVVNLDIPFISIQLHNTDMQLLPGICQMVVITYFLLTIFLSYMCLPYIKKDHQLDSFSGKYKLAWSWHLVAGMDQEQPLIFTVVPLARGGVHFQFHLVLYTRTVYLHFFVHIHMPFYFSVRTWYCTVSLLYMPCRMHVNVPKIQRDRTNHFSGQYTMLLKCTGIWCVWTLLNESVIIPVFHSWQTRWSRRQTLRGTGTNSDSERGAAAADNASLPGNSLESLYSNNF